MFIRLERRQTTHMRPSKLGLLHEYSRLKQVAVMRCDQCDTVFERDLKHIDKKRLDDNYFHCCGSCDSKKFGQKKSVESKKIWDMPAGTDLPVGKF